MVASAPDNSTAPQLDVLLFRLAGEVYALPSACVREVIRYRDYTPVPGAPATLPGILNQRGVVVPVVDIYPLLGLSAPPASRATRLVMLSHQEIDMALLVEAVLDLAALPPAALEPPPPALDPARARFLRGLATFEQQPVALLDLDELIAGLRAWE
ncbi:MAG TPA: chemotaxis protein CheW [Kouleothrix sp.]|uniref:chemotaxis protein CheW n=1 Tax=Kouleothrix sp. TaxID=2779161 RepID=UPI002BCF238B|nr:chemotaxis protein CheW [Kouleothrix sp.]